MRLSLPPSSPIARSAVSAYLALMRAMRRASPASASGGSPSTGAPNRLCHRLRATCRPCAMSAWPSAVSSFACTAAISSSTCGWQRTAPCPNTMSARVRMFAPSTVIAIGACR
ncbi:hypothetical protein D3C72_1820150 [compost metagenome]